MAATNVCCLELLSLFVLGLLGVEFVWGLLFTACLVGYDLYLLMVIVSFLFIF